MIGRQEVKIPQVFSIALMACLLGLSGCQGPNPPAPNMNWAPGAGARIAPPATGRGAYGSPDAYYPANVPRQSAIPRYPSYAERDDRVRSREFAQSRDDRGDDWRDADALASRRDDSTRDRYRSAPRDAFSDDARRDYAVAPASYTRSGGSTSRPLDRGDRLPSGGMPKSGEPRRFDTDDRLRELTDLPPRDAATPRSTATLIPPTRPRRPYDESSSWRDETRRPSRERTASSASDSGWRVRSD